MTSSHFIWLPLVLSRQKMSWLTCCWKMRPCYFRRNKIKKNIRYTMKVCEQNYSWWPKHHMHSKQVRSTKRHNGLVLWKEELEERKKERKKQTNKQTNKPLWSNSYHILPNKCAGELAGAYMIIQDSGKKKLNEPRECLFKGLRSKGYSIWNPQGGGADWKQVSTCFSLV